MVPWQGQADGFDLSSLCRDPVPMSFHALTATGVVEPPCMTDGVEITSFADAVAALDAPKGDDISDRVDLTIDGHPQPGGTSPG